MIVTAPAPAAPPAVTCATWCRDGSGHTNAIVPEDQWCESEGFELPLTMDPGKLDFLTVYVDRDPGAVVARVQINRGGGCDTAMTPAEARRLASALLVSASVAERA